MSQFQFRTPANIQDFADDSQKQQALVNLWNQNLNGFIQQGLMGNPWNATNVPVPTNYYNPLDDSTPSTASSINWFAFPGRLAYNYSNSQSQLNQMADTGVMPGPISNNPCGDASEQIPYYPYGPRGWQDEYCEWAVTRDATTNKITRIDFTCENPEYWNSLWLIDPNTVLALYRSILNKPQITLADLTLPNAKNPVTGGPIYNPLNIWNSGSVSNETQGGAIHLTSTPNTLQTEIGLASAATVLRTNTNVNPATTNWSLAQYNLLLCDAQYGQKHRNSDPTIGGNVNNLISEYNLVATLADPPGLYIQMPVFSTYAAPDKADVSTFWTILRGSETLNDQNGTPLPGNFILHAVFEVPSTKDYVVGDITIAGANIDWASQVALTFQMQIVASVYQGTTTPKCYPPVGNPTVAYAQPLQLFYADYYAAMYNTLVPNPVNNPIPLLSNSTYVPPQIAVPTQAVNMVLVCISCTAVSGQANTYPSVTFSDANITATVNSVTQNISYAVPGNSMPSTYTALFITVNVLNNATIGFPAIYVTNAGQETSNAMPALLNVI